MPDIAAIESLLEFLTPEEKAELDRLLVNGNNDLWQPLPGPQTEAYESEADIIGYGGAAGGGKALATDTPIITPYGMRAIGDLRVGDAVLAADGTRTQVIGVFPQGVRPLYRVTFQDGASLLADADHRWNYCVARKGRWRKSGRAWKVGTTAQLAEQMDNGRRLLIPTCAPLRFTKSYKTPQRTIDPYVLGLLLGDGYTAQSGPGAKWSFATEDAELLSALPGDWVPDSGCSYRLRGPWRDVLQGEFERLGLTGCKADTKFVPEPYKWAPVADRWAVLQGLMDTDGTAADGKAYFCSISKRLAEDVQWLVRSLGGRATLTSRVPLCTNGANGPAEGATAWQVYVRLPDNAEAFRLERKRRLAKCDKPVKRRIVSIEREGEGEAVCIAVDHPDSLYVAGEGCVVTHNTDLACGKALTAHKRVMILRREATQLTGIIDRLTELLGGRDGYNGQEKIWRLPKRGVQIEFGSVPNPGDETKYQGRPHDLLVFDEAANFLEHQVRFLLGWLRTTDPDQKCQALLTFNPPTTPEGRWIIDFFAPWLDDKHPNPAKPGEIRWFASVEGEEIEVESGEPFYHGDELIAPMSRTFIPSRIADNPYLMGTGYMTQLQSLPEPLRSQMLHGDFRAGMEDDPWQVIPSAWVDEAMNRWKPRDKKERMHSMGVDVARGGKDNTVIARRHEGMWFDEPIVIPGTATPEGSITAGHVISERRDRCPVHVDVIGWGSEVYAHLQNNQVQVIGVNGAVGVEAVTKENSLRFANLRAKLYWRMREALDPAADTGIALPPDNRLRRELCSLTWELRSGKIFMEPKEKVREKLGFSPDFSDAYVMALIDTPRHEDMPGQGEGAQARKRRDYNPYGKSRK